MSEGFQLIISSSFACYLIVRLGFFSKNRIVAPFKERFVKYDIQNYIVVTRYNIETDKGTIFKGWSVQPLDIRQ